MGKSSLRTVSSLLLSTLVLLALLGTSFAQRTNRFVRQTTGLSESWYVKASFPDYAPSGMPDFDQKQSNWSYPDAGYTWCGPVSAANFLWWLDSKYESLLNPFPISPPTNSDGFPLVIAYGRWDDHDPSNVEPFVNDLAFFMDTDGIRTHIAHNGTLFKDFQVGISQYLAKKYVRHTNESIINPLGDCDGDGDVDYEDILTIAKLFAVTPASPRWNMAADINMDNKIDMKDIGGAATSYGKVGMFCEHAEEFPAFQWIADKVSACSCVVLMLEFWKDLGDGTWERYVGEPGGSGGHYVTVAGVNSTTSELLISDPWLDAFEIGAAPGESPVQHLQYHLPDVHNDTQFVSHDAYVASPWLSSQNSPYLANVLELVGYPSSLHAFIRAAIVSSPITIAVLNAGCSKTPCDPRPTVGRGWPANVTALIENRGETMESFIASAYMNGTLVGSKTIVDLPVGTNVTVDVAAWNTTEWAYGDYYVTVGTNSSYQAFTPDFSTNSTKIRLTISGDVNGDWTVDIYDAILFANAMSDTVPGDPNWSVNADINGDGVVDIFDAIVLAGNYNQSIPQP